MIYDRKFYNICNKNTFSQLRKNIFGNNNVFSDDLLLWWHSCVVHLVSFAQWFSNKSSNNWIINTSRWFYFSSLLFTFSNSWIIFYFGQPWSMYIYIYCELTLLSKYKFAGKSTTFPMDNSFLLSQMFNLFQSWFIVTCQIVL